MNIEYNEKLRSDWPLLDAALELADGSAVKASRITYLGEPINFVYKTTELTLPRTAESSGAGASLAIAGIEGRIRGLKKQTVDGRSIRPDLILIDDVQTRASAESPSKVLKRERILKSDIMGLAGPDKSISGLIACTVIKRDDLADRILDSKKNPQFRGIRGKLVYDMPKNMDLWNDYFKLRSESLLEHGDNRLGLDYYVNNREAMDEGSRVAWEDRKKSDQVSGIQFALDLMQDDRQAFLSEYQNEPLDDYESEGQKYLTPKQVRAKATRENDRGRVPQGYTKLTGFVDVQENLLYYTVIAWREDSFAGHIVDYGSFPDQQSLMYRANDAPIPFSQVYPKSTLDAQLYRALEELVGALLSWDWIAEDEQHLRISRILIDANFAKSTDVIYRFCRQSVYASLIDPSHGKYFGASSTPMNDQKKQKGENRGHNWVMPSPRNNRKRRYVIYDTNYWKTFINDRLMLSLGDPGTISIFGDPDRHEMLSQHLTSEVSIDTSGKGRELQEWKKRASHSENHWFDCVVGAAVAASIEGLKTDQEVYQEETKRRRVVRGRIRKPIRNRRR
jgi:hypothetical protein